MMFSCMYIHLRTRTLTLIERLMTNKKITWQKEHKWPVTYFYSPKVNDCHVTSSSPSCLLRGGEERVVLELNCLERQREGRSDDILLRSLPNSLLLLFFDSQIHLSCFQGSFTHLTGSCSLHSWPDAPCPILPRDPASEQGS